MRVRIPRNIGFMMLATDVRELYREGLELARGFLETEQAAGGHQHGRVDQADVVGGQDQRPAAQPGRYIGWFLIGQMAWNYAFERRGYETLPGHYNVPVRGLAAPTASDESAGEVLVRHYLGPHKKRLMFLDFLLLHSGEPRNGAGAGGFYRNTRA
jgi:hypothetical protein